MKRVNKTNTSGIVFKLAEVMKEKGYSINRLSIEANLRFETVQGYYYGTISRVDLYVLGSLCKILNCNIQDIIEYKPECAN